jgi:predicted dinucleotide-binding enzyme
MKIGIIGTGNIGKTLVRTLAKAGHDIKIANSRGPESIDEEILSFGVSAVATDEVVQNVDVIILSIPFAAHVKIKPLLADVPGTTVVIDTANYYPARDGTIDAIEDGQVESLWVVEQLGRPIAKAWNAIGARAFAEFGMSPGGPERVAIPVAADREIDKDVAMRLVEETGFDAFDAGSLEDSWRQQPGAPAYCTNLKKEEMAEALAAAEKERLPKRRDLASSVVLERYGLENLSNADAEYGIKLNRLIYM